MIVTALLDLFSGPETVEDAQLTVRYAREMLAAMACEEGFTEGEVHALVYPDGAYPRAKSGRVRVLPLLHPELINPVVVAVSLTDNEDAITSEFYVGTFDLEEGDAE